MVYSKEDKLRIIKLYLEGVNIYPPDLTPQQKDNMRKRIKNWVNVYKKFGEQGLELKAHRYTPEQKIAAVERVLNGESRYQVSYSLGLTNRDTIRDWIRKYEKYGKDAFKDPNKQVYFKAVCENKNDTAFFKEENRLLKEKIIELEAEIEYLKKLQALILK